MTAAYFWHIESAVPIETAQFTTTDKAPIVLSIFRATYRPIAGDMSDIVHPQRRTALNVWANIALTEESIRSIRERHGWDEPIWIGYPTCCQSPSFWGIEDDEEELSDAPYGVSTEGAAWAAEQEDRGVL